MIPLQAVPTEECPNVLAGMFGGMTVSTEAAMAAGALFVVAVIVQILMG